MQPRAATRHHLGKIALLALLYICTGKLGLLLAVPPGYATIIWPPSGIALGMLLVHGRSLWPGVLLGSFLLNAHASGLFTAAGFDAAQALTALGIALGSTTQALTARALIDRYIGAPLHLEHLRQVLRLLALAGPLACLIAATVGTGTLYLSGALSWQGLSANWFSWWLGDIFGIVVFLPLVLVAPGSRNRLVWRDRTVNALPLVAMLVVLVPLGMTFYAWKIASESAYRQTQAELQSMAAESERALLFRLDSYANALLGGAGLVHSTPALSRQHWRDYVHALQVANHLPGINGIGWIEAVAAGELGGYLRTARADGAADFSIHPPLDGPPHYIIRYIEPEQRNSEALGLDIAFEPHRLEAAHLARDSGKPAITRRIVLVQDTQKSPGFLLLHPIYRDGPPLHDVAARRAALRGWVYAPFVARNFLANLTGNHGHKLSLKVYDGHTAVPQALIYGDAIERTSPAAFVVHQRLEVMQQRWLLVWESTPAFEQAEQTSGPLFILVGGLLFTGLFGLFLMVFTLRRTESMESIAGEHHYALPFAVFLALALGSYLLFKALHEKEQSYLRRWVQDQAARAESTLSAEINHHLQALNRMAQRWDAAGRTPLDLWRSDARSHTQQLPGLKALEWVDSSLHVRWIEPRSGNENAVGLAVAVNQAQALEHAAHRNSPTLTAPFQLVQGYTAFIAYQPLTVSGRFDGFLAGIFSVEDFFRAVIAEKITGDYAFSISYQGQRYFGNDVPAALQDARWASETRFQIYDQQWTLSIVPTRELTASQQSPLPLVVLSAGMLIALLSAVSLHYILTARLKSAYLVESHRLNSAILSSTASLIIATDGRGTILLFNKAAQDALGYTAQEVVGKATPALWHDGAEVAQRAASLSAELGLPIEPGFDVFICKPLQDGIESRQWTYIRKDGSRFPVNLTVTTLCNDEGRVTGYLGVIENITERVQQQQALNASAEQMRLLVENTPAAVAMFDRDLKYLLTSRRWVEDYRLQGRQLIGKSHYEVFPEMLGRPSRLDIHQRALEGEVFELQEDSWVRQDGRKEWITWAIHPWIDNAGAVGGIVMFTEVITGRKQAEEALRSSEELFRTAMAHAPIGQALLSPHGQWQKVNPALCRLLGYSEAELLAIDFQSITYPDDLEHNLAELQRLLSGAGDTYQLEKRYWHRSGRPIWTQVSASLVRRADGAPDYLITQIQDISERKEIERLKNEFISVVSHELRTPLTSIRGSLGLILGAFSGNLPAKFKGLIDIAYNNCERLTLLINDILDIDKIAAGHMRFDLAAQSLAAVTLQAVQANEAYARKLGVSIRLAPFDGGIMVALDAHRYIQVLTNLLSNAAKFSPVQGVVEVSAAVTAQRVRISVSDHGAGITEEFRARIFGRFMQADSSATRAKGGTGLGLHIAKQLVEHMNGTIGFDSQLGQGSTFWVEFPIATEQ